ncbi:MAG: P-loop NTPase [Candidatus Methylomirabilales bacterium]
MKKYRDIAGDGGSHVIQQVEEQIARLKARMAGIKTQLAVMSGKGGVGKSAVTANLAAAFAMRGSAVGILDADLNGPTIAKMMGVRGQRLGMGEEGVHPALGPLGIKVMSMDLLLPREETPVIWDAPTQQDSFVWRATLEVSALREFLTDAVWGELDFLLIDLPPGTDRIWNIAGVLPEIDGPSLSPSLLRSPSLW